jgi:hypothetical protein
MKMWKDWNGGNIDAPRDRPVLVQVVFGSNHVIQFAYWSDERQLWRTHANSLSILTWAPLPDGFISEPVSEEARIALDADIDYAVVQRVLESRDRVKQGLDYCNGERMR